MERGDRRHIRCDAVPKGQRTCRRTAGCEESIVESSSKFNRRRSTAHKFGADEAGRSLGRVVQFQRPNGGARVDQSHGVGARA